MWTTTCIHDIIVPEYISEDSCNFRSEIVLPLYTGCAKFNILLAQNLNWRLLKLPASHFPLSLQKTFCCNMWNFLVRPVFFNGFLLLMILNLENFRKKITHSEPPTVLNESWHRRSTNLVTSQKRQWAKQWMPSPVSLERRTLFLELKNSKNPDLWKKVAVFWEPIYTRPLCIQVQFLLHLRVQWFLGNFKIHWHSIDPPVEMFVASNDLLGEKIGLQLPNLPMIPCGQNDFKNSFC